MDRHADLLYDNSPALVVVVNNRADWQRVVKEGWYRIPLKHAPQPVAAAYLAFYLTRPFGQDAWQVAYYTPVLRYSTASRRELLPDEPDHPRAAERYYRVAVGPVRRLARPVPSRSLRRITFIPTTFGCLHTASDVTELWQVDEASAILWTHFPDAALKATRRLDLDQACQ